MSRRIPDVPRMQDPGLYEYLQALRREVVALGDQLDAQDVGFKTRVFRDLYAPGVVTAADLGNVIQIMGAGVQLTLPEPNRAGFGYGQTVEVLNFAGPVTIVGGAECGLVDTMTGSFFGAGAPISIPGPNRTVLTSGFSNAWWVEIARP